MAPPVGTLRVGRYFLALLITLGLLYTMVFWPGARHTPKLGLDLVGGTQVIFTAKTEAGKTPSKSSMSQAKQIMENRVNGSGVTEATVIIQGSNQIVISIPGNTSTDVAKLGRAAVLSFRGVVMPTVQIACTGHSTTGGTQYQVPVSATVTASAVNTAFVGAGIKPLVAPAVVANSKPAYIAVDTVGGLTAAKQKTLVAAVAKKLGLAATKVTDAPLCAARPFAALEKSGVKIPTSEAEFTKPPKLTAAQITAQQDAIKAALGNFDCDSAQDEKDDPKSYFLACQSGQVFLLGTVIVPGHEIKGASAQAPNVSQGQVEWTVQLSLKSTGSRNWSKYTASHNIGGGSGQNPSVTSCGASSTPCADFVAFTLDGNVISAPVNNDAIPEGSQTQITGNFTQKSAKELADQLKYGALPLSFKAEDAQTVSATLGTSQLKAGLLAGGIGLILVVLYSLIYYRALGLVTIASLIVSGTLTYGALVILGTQIGFTLSLAGIAGFIVAVGITADSFVVFFERMKDEVHEGRSARVAIPRAWIRARRTILSADTVSFLAAATLYYFAAGDVKGFAFTLGLSTVLDLVVVFLFTHPLVSWLSRKKGFGSSRFTGLNAMRDGGIAAPAPEHTRVHTKPARTKAAPTAKAAKAAKATKAPVAVLERADEPDDEPEVIEDTVAARDEADEVDEAPGVTDTENADPENADTENADTEDGEAELSAAAKTRRRTAPEPGSAAERAAQRRARMRAQADEKGKS